MSVSSCLALIYFMVYNFVVNIIRTSRGYYEYPETLYNVINRTSTEPKKHKIISLRPRVTRKRFKI